MPPRLRAFYETVVRKDLLHQLRKKNVHQVPALDHVAVSMATNMRTGTLNVRCAILRASRAILG